MKFSLNQKIEEIRQKPEHIRMRYVWAWLAISMIFIFGIWIFSVKENFKSVNLGQDQLPDLKSGMPNLKESLPSMGDFQKGLDQSSTSSEGFEKESITSLQNDKQ